MEWKKTSFGNIMKVKELVELLERLENIYEHLPDGEFIDSELDSPLELYNSNKEIEVIYKFDPLENKIVKQEIIVEKINKIQKNNTKQDIKIIINL